jgi:HSP20 family protein
MQVLCKGNRFSQTANELENIFNQVFGAAVPGPAKFVPPADIVETDTDFQITLELPGVKLEEIAVEFTDDQLQISGEKKVVCDETAKACTCTERRGGSFSRTFRFATAVDNEKVEARLENGLLTVKLPKAAQVLPRKIEIRSGK